MVGASRWGLIVTGVYVSSAGGSCPDRLCKNRPPPTRVGLSLSFKGFDVGSVLRIGVDFHAFDGKFQGSRSHLIGLYRAMVRLCPDFEFVFFLGDVEGLRNLAGFDLPNVEVVYMPPANPLKRLAWQLPILRQRYRIDILHTQYIVPLWPAKGNAVTIHDVLFENYPQFFTPFFVWRSKWLFRRSARVADIVMTVSEYSRQEIATRYKVQADRIGLLRNAVDPLVFQPGGGADEQVLTKRGLCSEGYWMTVGRIEPRKDHATLMRAYHKLGPGVPPLVIVGQRDFGYGEFDAALKALPAASDVRVWGDVDDKELPVLLRHAQVFIYPSLAEGFGMPPLEAMACGVPVITSDATALPEVVGDAGLLFAPGDADGLARQLDALMRDATLRQTLARRGVERAKTYSWDEGARQLRQACLRWRSANG